MDQQPLPYVFSAIALTTGLAADHLFVSQKKSLSRKGLRILAFRRPCPVECLPYEMRSIFHWGEAYSSGVSEKLININLSVLAPSP
jgi:hypothetical protein